MKSISFYIEIIQKKDFTLASRERLIPLIFFTFHKSYYYIKQFYLFLFYCISFSFKYVLRLYIVSL